MSCFKFKSLNPLSLFLCRVWRKGSPPVLLVGMSIGVVTIENSTKVHKKTKNRVAI